MLRGFCWFQWLFWQFPCPALHPAHTVNAVCSALSFFSSHKSKYQFPDQMWVMLACACALLPEQLFWLCPVPSEPSRSLRWLFLYNLKVKDTPERHWNVDISGRAGSSQGYREYKNKTQDAKWVSEKHRTKAPVTVPLHGTPASALLLWNRWMQRGMLKM